MLLWLFQAESDKYFPDRKKFEKLKTTFIAETFLSVEKTLSRKHDKKIEAPDEVFEKIFEELENEKISKEIIPKIILDYSETNDFNKKFS